MPRGFDDTLLIFEINIHQSKSWPISFSPFEVVKKSPYKIALDNLYLPVSHDKLVAMLTVNRKLF